MCGIASDVHVVRESKNLLTVEPRTEDPEEFNAQCYKFIDTNILGNIHLFKFFLPLVMKSNIKKVIHITSGHADLDPICEFDVDPAALYSISKAGMNVAVAKFSAQYKKDGVLFMSISPGVVDVGNLNGGKKRFLLQGGR